MILYNVTINIDKAVQKDWLQWMRKEHIPAVMATGLFVEHKLLRLLTEEANTDFTYAIQYFLRSQADLATYQAQYAPALQKAHQERYKDYFVAFRSVLEVIE
ncbi:MAG: DUF4286 family protein [Bacteroidota bacterium]